MNSSNLDTLIATASELALEERWRETVDTAKKAVEAEPRAYGAWYLLGLAYERLGLDKEAVEAFGAFYRHSPATSDLRALRSFAAEKAGLLVEDEHSREESTERMASDCPLVNLFVMIAGKRVLLQARNDSGKDAGEVIKVAEELVGSTNPFQAWVHLARHPELMSELGDLVLTTIAKAQSSVQVRTGIERYRNALRRVKGGEGVKPFAEMAEINNEDFIAFVTAANDLQPIIQKLAQLENPAEQKILLGHHPELVQDHRTLIFLRFLGGLQRTREARETLQSLFTLIRRAKLGRGTAQVPKTPEDLRLAEERANAAIERGDLQMLDAAIEEWNTAISRKDVDTSLAASTQAGLLMSRYERTGHEPDLANACKILETALKHEPDPDWPNLPYNYGVLLLRRFERKGDVADLNLAIAYVRQALALVVDGTKTEGAARNVLGVMLMRRSEVTGSLLDLNDGISAQRLSITSEALPKELALRLVNLAAACLQRFTLTGDVGDLDEADRSYREVLELQPSSSIALGGMGRVLRSRYHLTNDPGLLDRAVESYQAAISRGGADFQLAVYYNNLSSALRERYTVGGHQLDIDGAIEASLKAVHMAPADSVERPRWLENLANNLRVRAVNQRNVKDREEAIAAFQEAIALARPGSDVWRTAPTNMGGLLHDFPDERNPDGAVRLLEEGFQRILESAADTDVVIGSSALAFELSRRGDWSRAADVLITGLDAVDRLQRIQLLSGAKKAWIAKYSELHMMAAEMLLLAGRKEEMVVAIERGRSRLLNEILATDRTAIAELESSGNHRLSERYRAAAEHVRLLVAATERGADVRQQLRAAHREFEAVIEQIRETPGGAVFGQPITIEDIRAASNKANAPIVYLAPMGEFGAILVISPDRTDIPDLLVRDMAAREVNSVVERYLNAYNEFISCPGERELRTQWETALAETVEWCWRACMRFVCTLIDSEQVVLIAAGRLGRLPLHAASGKEGSALNAFSVRYSPSSNTLLKLGAATPDSILTISFADQSRPLAYSTLETAAARQSFANTRALDHEEATVAAVRESMRDATVLHFACHASAAGSDTVNSGLQLADGILSLQELFETRVPDGATVVLSACETGVIDNALPDEVLSVASATLRAGASAVVSSLWAVPDVSTAVLMTAFYFLWREKAMPADAALRGAQIWMRDSNNREIAAFLQATMNPELVRDLTRALESKPDESTFGHCFHWAAFTYSGQQ